MALQNGVDIVCELPYIYAVQKAETFANGAVSILDALKCRSLFFGSEDGDIKAFERTAHAWHEKEEIDLSQKQRSKKGLVIRQPLPLRFKRSLILNTYWICLSPITF